MRETIEYNFSKFEEAVNSLCRYLNLEEETVLQYLNSETREFSADIFLRTLDIPEENLLEYDLLLTALHVTTSNDECSSIQRYGLLNLQNAIRLDTTLGRYIREHGVDIDFVEKNIRYDNRVYNIGLESFRRSSVDSEEETALYDVIEKLYTDYQINAFFSHDNALQYAGSVSSRPEFLEDLSYLLDNRGIERDWRYNRSNSCFVIKFVERPSAFSDDTFELEAEEVQRLSEGELEIKRRKWIIEKTLEVIYMYTNHRILPENIAYLRFGIEIQPSNIREIHTRDEYLENYVTVRDC
ncbi:TPA: hypothetical protein ACGXMA_000560 [Bacillus cereus]|uniref:hypothetical protein n=1 Tax=Bacillus sp. Gnz1/3 TaxID=3418491 RepID=UPI000BFE77CB|nr:hypothetical protein COE12_23600 [Bacillus anthracis]